MEFVNSAAFGVVAALDHRAHIGLRPATKDQYVQSLSRPASHAASLLTSPNLWNQATSYSFGPIATRCSMFAALGTCS